MRAGRGFVVRDLLWTEAQLTSDSASDVKSNDTKNPFVRFSRATAASKLSISESESILKNSVDALPPVEPPSSSPPPPHDNIRGAEYFD